MRTLYLHIGHGKTGSSWLQSCLSLSREALARAGIAYPVAKFDALAKEGRVTPGNGQALIDAFGDRRLARQLARQFVEGHALFSSELLANQIAARLRGGELRAFMDRCGFERLSVLLFIRDPLEHVASHYQQVVKRAGETRSQEAFAKSYDTPERMADALTALAEVDYADVTVWNYSREKDHLLGHLAAWLTLPNTLFTQPDRKIVNRSLTEDELALQLIFNRHFGRCGPLISDPLSEDFPHLQPDLAPLSYKAAKALIDRLKPAMEAVNAMIPSAQAYQVQAPNRWTRERAKTDVTLSFDQLDAVAKRLAERMKDSG